MACPWIFLVADDNFGDSKAVERARRPGSARRNGFREASDRRETISPA